MPWRPRAGAYARPSVAWQMSIPNNTAFLGLVLYEQAAMFSAGMNPLGIVTSNAIAATLGL